MCFRTDAEQALDWLERARADAAYDRNEIANPQSAEYQRLDQQAHLLTQAIERVMAAVADEPECPDCKPELDRQMALEAWLESGQPMLEIVDEHPNYWLN